MKKIFTILASLFVTVALFAAAPRPTTSITIHSADRNDIRVVIDGRRFEPNDNFMTIRGIQTGYHQVKVYRERNSGRFTIFGQKYDMVYNNSIYVRPSTNLMINIDRNGRAQVIENRGRNNDRNNGRWGQNGRDYDYEMGRNYGDYGDHDRDWNDRDSRWGNRDQNGGWGNKDQNGGWDKGNGGYGNNGGYGSKAMDDYEFSRALNSINMQRDQFRKMDNARQVINMNYFTSSQVRQMLQSFSFENDKLDLAKMAYDKTIDKQNFYLVNDAFSYSTTKDELARWVRTQR